MSAGYYKKIKEMFPKKAQERFQNILKNGQKIVNMLVNDIEIFLK